MTKEQLLELYPPRRRSVDWVFSKPFGLYDPRHELDAPPLGPSPAHIIVQELIHDQGPCSVERWPGSCVNCIGYGYMATEHPSDVPVKCAHCEGRGFEYHISVEGLWYDGLFAPLLGDMTGGVWQGKTQIHSDEYHWIRTATALVCGLKHKPPR